MNEKNKIFKQIKMQQILIAPFITDTGSSYSVLGLSNEGIVYRYDPMCQGWIAWPMVEAECRENHKAKR